MEGAWPICRGEAGVAEAVTGWDKNGRDSGEEAADRGLGEDCCWGEQEENMEDVEDSVDLFSGDGDLEAGEQEEGEVGRRAAAVLRDGPRGTGISSPGSGCCCDTS